MKSKNFIALYYYSIPLIITLLYALLLFFKFENLDSSIITNFLIIIMTYFLVVFAWVNLKKSRDDSYLQNRAYLIFDIEFEEGIFYFFLKNIGKTPAFEVEVRSIPDLKMFNISSLNEVFKSKISFFPPGKEIKSDFDYSEDFFQREIIPTIIISYKDSEGKIHSESTTIDLSFRKGLLYKEKKKIDHLVKSLDKINSSIQNLTKSNINNDNLIKP